MPIKRYGVLRARPRACLFASEESPHFQIHAHSAAGDFRIAVNVSSIRRPPSLLCLIQENVRPDLAARMSRLASGFTLLRRRRGGLALDYVRGGLFDPGEMRLCEHTNDLMDQLISEAIQSQTGELFAFGQRWGPDPARPDPHFGFLPGNGIHNIHMNQGNMPPFLSDDGVWQDGALFLRFPDERWIGIFLAFPSQSFRTDRRTGRRLDVLPAEALTQGQRNRR